jgi:hypothetical protein
MVAGIDAIGICLHVNNCLIISLMALLVMNFSHDQREYTNNMFFRTFWFQSHPLTTLFS